MPLRVLGDIACAIGSLGELVWPSGGGGSRHGTACQGDGGEDC